MRHSARIESERVNRHRVKKFRKRYDYIKGLSIKIIIFRENKLNEIQTCFLSSIFKFLAASSKLQDLNIIENSIPK